MDDAKPSHVVMAEQAERIKSLQATVQEQQKAVKLLQDGWRKSAGRLKAKRKAVGAARDDERRKHREKEKAFKREANAEAMEKAEQKFKDDIEKSTRLKNNTNARARTVEKSQGKLKRKVARLEKNIDEMKNASDAEDEDDDADEEEAAE